MPAPSDRDMEYARKQLSEASRRLDSVVDQIAETIPIVVGEDTDTTIINEKIAQAEGPSGIYSTLDGSISSLQNLDDNEAIVINRDLAREHIQNSIIDCQMCVELSVKSMFKIVGVQFDFSHGVSFDSGNTRGLYHEILDEFSRKDEIPRAIFLTQFWEQFYELAKYGSPNLNVGPSAIFSAEDAQRALIDAGFCVELAEELLEYVEENRD